MITCFGNYFYITYTEMQMANDCLTIHIAYTLVYNI